MSNHSKYKKTYKQSFANKLGRLTQGAGETVDGTYTMFFISKYQVPKDQIKDVMYGCILVDYWPQKQELHRMRLTVGEILFFTQETSAHLLQT